MVALGNESQIEFNMTTSGYRSISAQVKNKAETMQRLIDAVGRIIKNKGYKGLGLNAIAKEADVSKILIHRYFGSVDGLVEAYVIGNDYWVAKIKDVKIEADGGMDRDALKKAITELLQNHFNYFYHHEAMRSIILWEITERTALLNSISQLREEVGGVLIEQAIPIFNNSKKSLTGVTAIIVSGIYYMVLHAKKNDSTICGVDINSKEGQKEILNTIAQIIDWTFAE